VTVAVDDFHTTSFRFFLSLGRGGEVSGATHEVGAPETRIMVPIELVLTPRDSHLKPGTWTRGHRSYQAYYSVFSRQL
jgi:hypothetical protein